MDKFGYYQVGTFKTYSKVESIELHKQTGIHPQWIFNENVFAPYNWKVEPLETLDELYARRAREIREKYDYVVLFYSGGADSSNILETFVKNGIPFDEIATYNYWAADPDPTSYFHSEQIKVSYPRIKELQDQGLKFKHRMIDLSELTLSVLKNPEYQINRAYYGAAHWGTSHLSKSYIRESTPDYTKIIDRGDKLAFVWGSEKPRLYKENGKYCLKFLDLIDTAIAIRTQILSRPGEFDELFYWAPESVDMICKQGHILKRFFEKHKLSQENYMNDQLIKIPGIEQVFANKNTEDGLSFRNLINMLIYTDFNPKTFSAGKNMNVLISPRDRVFNSDQEYRLHLDRLRQHFTQLDEYWLNDKNDIEKGLKLCVSPAYYLE